MVSILSSREPIFVAKYEEGKGLLKMNAVKTRVKYIVSYFNGSLLLKSTPQRHTRIFCSEFPSQYYITIKWLEARDFALHTFARFLAALEYIWIINCAVTFVDEKRSQSDATNVLKLDWLQMYAEESPKYKM